MDNKQSFKSWFCVFNNPQKVYEGEPKDIAEKVLELWIDNKSTRTGAVAYCISMNGLHHLHMVFEDSNKCRFSALKKLFPESHIEPTRGNKEQAEDYINKKGKFEEKGEQVLYIARYGSIKGYQGQRKDLEIISDLIDEGKRPNEIFENNFAYRRYESMIKSAYFHKRNKETSFIRNVKVYWHVGDSGSGKSYSSHKLVDMYGEDEVYILADYENGGFDNYCGEKVLFIDEFRGQFNFAKFLKILDKYKCQVHARYSNVLSLWDEVHITSVLTPHMCYTDIVENQSNNLDTIKQLDRRIDYIVYHEKYKGEYLSHEISYTDFKSYIDLVRESHLIWDTFGCDFNEDDFEEVI